jgi:hypothetical protein
VGRFSTVVSFTFTETTAWSFQQLLLVDYLSRRFAVVVQRPTDVDV